MVNAEVLERELIVIVDKCYLTLGKSTTEKVRLNTIRVLGELLSALP